MRARASTAFTLIEVTVSLVILALSLTVLLEVQAQSLANASRARGLTIAAMLARSKMVDVEQHLFDDGFTLGDDSDEGDFEEEGHPKFKWSYTIQELELDLSGLEALAGGMGGDESEAAATDMSGLMGGLGGALESFTTELGQSMRLVQLEVTWPEGAYEEKLNISAIMTREDYALGAAQDSAFDITNPTK